MVGALVDAWGDKHKLDRNGDQQRQQCRPGQ
jgi:hypothetical protein